MSKDLFLKNRERQYNSLSRREKGILYKRELEQHGRNTKQYNGMR